MEQQLTLNCMEKLSKSQQKKFLEKTNTSPGTIFSPFDATNKNNGKPILDTRRKSCTKNSILAALVVVPTIAIAVLLKLSAESFENAPRLPYRDALYAQDDLDFLLIQIMGTFIITTVSTMACVCVDTNL